MNGIYFAICTLSCDLYRIRGFRIKLGGGVDLEDEVYTSPPMKFYELEKAFNALIQSAYEEGGKAGAESARYLAHYPTDTFK